MASYLSQHLEKIVLAQCEDTNTPRSLCVAMLVRAREYGQLFTLKIDPAHYSDSESFLKDNQVTEFLRKLELDVPGIDREAVALQNFFGSEHLCKRTNIRLSRFVDRGPYQGPSDVRIADLFSVVRKEISNVLGAVPQDLTPKHGKGATFADRGRLTTIPDKMSSRPTCTLSSRCLLPLWEKTAWARALMKEYPTLSDPLVVRGNRFTTVPKDALKRRGICIEPSLSLSYQLAVGSLLKRKLSAAGMDLTFAQSKHREIAMEASRSGAYATIDLSNASDTVCTELVKLLLPPMWYDLLSSLRSTHTLVKGKWYRLEKFSSMGNGYTFELETLIFACLAKGCAVMMGLDLDLGRGINVYGDDIIVPTEMAETMLACLRFAGFTPNPRKTFVEGPFRESCGGDFFNGMPVRAHYLEEDPHEPQNLIALANGISRLAFGEKRNPDHWRFYRRSWFKCLDGLPSHIRGLRGPPSTGDLTINDAQWNFRETPDGRAFVRTYSPVTRCLDWKHWKPEIALASALYGVASDGVSYRDNVEGYRMKWVAVLERPPAISST